MNKNFIEGNNGVQIWDSILSEEQLSRVEKLCEGVKLEEGLVGAGNTLDSSVRVSKVGFFEGASREEIFQLGDKVLKGINIEAYGFDITEVANVQLTVYTEGSKYTWHSDSVLHPIHDVKLTAVLLLSDPGEYKGGALEVFEGTNLKLENVKKGSIVSFPSYLSHRVQEVTEGVRVTLVFWARGPRFR